MLSIIHSLTTLGIDLSYYQGNVQLSTFQCLHNQGYHFAIFQAQIGSTYNTNAPSDYHNAKSAGFANVDFYIFPTISQDPKTQVRNTITKLQQAGVMTGNMIWFDIESASSWHPSCSQNQQFLKNMLDEASSMLGANRVGIYASASQWSPIMCGWTGASGHQLWYPHYDNSASFSDFKPFGGWSKPAIKQFAGDTKDCSTDIDKDFY